MIIYVDLLVTVNFVIDFLLFSSSAVILRTEIKTGRQILASLLGGFSSIYIFLENDFLIFDIIFRIFFSAIMVLVCIGVKPIARYIKFYITYLTSTLMLGGAMFFVSEISRNKFVAINNTYAYINISPILLIIVTIMVYIGLKLYFRFKKSPDANQNCEITLYLERKECSYSALIDTGNRVKDVMGNSEILFITPAAFVDFSGITPDLVEERFANRLRLIPINTVNASGIKRGIRIDRAEVLCGKLLFELKNPVLLITESDINSEVKMIVSSEILLKQPTKVLKEGK